MSSSLILRTTCFGFPKQVFLYLLVLNNLYFRYLFAAILLFLMLLTSTVCREPEFIFPEIAALCVGFVVVDKRVWNVGPASAILLLFLSSVIGSLISAFSTFSYPINMLIGIISVFCLLRLFNSNFYPILSACLLPIVFNCGGVLYVIVVILGVLAVFATRQLTIMLGLRLSSDDKLIISYKNTFIAFGLRAICIFSVILLFDNFAIRYALLPPLVVAFVEISFNKSGMRKGASIIVLLLIVASALGAIAVYSTYFGLPIYVSVTVAELLMFLVFELCHRKFAPAAAIVVVPALISPTSLSIYFIGACCGSITFVFLAVCVAWLEKRYNFVSRV